MSTRQLERQASFTAAPWCQVTYEGTFYLLSSRPLDLGQICTVGSWQRGQSTDIAGHQVPYQSIKQPLCRLPPDLFCNCKIYASSISQLESCQLARAEGINSVQRRASKAPEQAQQSCCNRPAPRKIESMLHGNSQSATLHNSSAANGLFQRGCSQLCSHSLLLLPLQLCLIAIERHVLLPAQAHLASFIFPCSSSGAQASATAMLTPLSQRLQAAQVSAQASGVLFAPAQQTGAART